MRLTVIPLVLLLAACKSSPETLEITGETMGTTFNVVAIDPDGSRDKETLATRIDQALADVNATMSNWDPSSEISRFNAAQGTDPVEISAQLATVVAAANEVHTASEGQFDVTLGPLIELWGFGARTPESPVPTDEAIAQALSIVGQDKILTLTQDPPTLAKSLPGTSVYLAAIAKGYGVDQVAAVLRAEGIENYMVEIGGDLVTAGTNPQGKPWTIGIERPNAAAGTIEEIVSVSDLGMATSGDYRNYFEQDGQRYSHIIDAETGRPITHGTASVTVLAADAMQADAWATALLVLGQERGMPIAEDRDLAVMFISRDTTAQEVQFTTTSSARFQELQSGN